MKFLIYFIFFYLISLQHASAEEVSKWSLNITANDHTFSIHFPLQDNKERILIIGDTKHDGEVALALGIDCLLLNCGHNDDSQLIQVPGKIIHCHNEINNYII